MLKLLNINIYLGWKVTKQMVVVLNLNFEVLDGIL